MSFITPPLVGTFPPPKEVLPVDEVALREQRLLQPGLAPIGPVRVDANHSLAKRLYALLLINRGCEFHTLQTYEPAVTTSVVLPARRAVLGNLTLNAGGRGASSDVGYTWTMPSETPAANSDFTFVVYMHNRQGGNQDSNGAILFLYGSAANNSLGISAEVGYWSVYANVRNASYYYSNVQANETYGSQKILYVFSKTGTTLWKVYRNGVEITPSSSTDNGVGIQAQTLTKEGITRSSYTELPPLYYAAAFGRAFSQDDAIALSADPYQFLVPA